MSDEFDFITRRLRPLAEGAPEALDLADDAAALPPRPGFDLIVTQDAIVEGVHYLATDPPASVAAKLLRANLSDLAAKAAEPYGYFLTAGWPAHYEAGERDEFVAGLRADQAEFGLRLFGGDTVASGGPGFFSATMLGWTPQGGMVRRSGARPGDLVWVTGSIGDAWLGLQAARGEIAVDAADREHLFSRYRRPNPRISLAGLLRDHATAAIDVSDGLLADIRHVAECSRVRAVIDLDRLPLSKAATGWLAAAPDQAAALGGLATGGDDYEICFTAPRDAADAISSRAAKLDVAVTAVGMVEAGSGVTARVDGVELSLDRLGYRHQLGGR